MTFEQVQHEKDFIQNWLSDLLDAMEAELDQPTLN
jgi:phytoene/squalene synthetase